LHGAREYTFKAGFDNSFKKNLRNNSLESNLKEILTHIDIEKLDAVIEAIREIYSVATH